MYKNWRKGGVGIGEVQLRLRGVESNRHADCLVEKLFPDLNGGIRRLARSTADSGNNGPGSGRTECQPR